MTEEHPLSDREIEVLQYVAAGLTNREIAQKLSISHNTVKVHLSNIFEKIGVASRTEATVYAIEHRIVDVPGGENVENNPRSEWLHFFRRFAWVWIGVGLLLLALLVKFTIDTFFPSPTPTALPTADIAERWKELAPMPEARQGMAAVAFDGNIYTLAGEGPKGVSGSVFRYLPEEDRWETLSDKPTPVTDVEGVVIGEKIYIPGGETVNGKPTDILEIYDPRQDTWETGALLPQALSAYALADFEGKMYLFGGWNGERAVDTVYEYNIQNDSWHKRTQMNMPSFDLGAVALEDKIVVLGGRKGEHLINSVVYYYPSRDNGPDSPWMTMADLPEDASNWHVAAVNDSLYLVMVSENEEVVLYQDKDKGWETLPTPPIVFFQDVLPLPLGPYIYLIGYGKDMNQQFWRYQAIYYEIYIPYVD